MKNSKNREEQMKFSFSDDELEQAARKVCEAIAKIEPDPEDAKHVFSPEFQAKMDALLRKNRLLAGLKRWGRNVAAALLVLLVGSGIWLGVDVEARAEFKRWIVSKYENSVLYDYFGKRTAEKLPSIEFGWLPEGYVETTADIGEDKGLYIFTYEDDNIIVYYDFISFESTFVVTEDNLVHKSIEVNGMPADFYMDLENERPCTLWWTDEDTGIAFNLSAVLGIEDMVKIAENIKITTG